MKGFVEDTDVDRVQFARRLLFEAGFAEKDARWAGDLIVSGGVFQIKDTEEETEAEQVENALRVYAQAVVPLGKRLAGDRDAFQVAAFQLLLGLDDECPPQGWVPAPWKLILGEEWQRVWGEKWVDVWASQPVDWARGIERARAQGVSICHRFCAVLLRHSAGQCDWAKIVNWQIVSQSGAGLHDGSDVHDPSRLEFWLASAAFLWLIRPSDEVRATLRNPLDREFRSRSGDDLARFAAGFLDTVYVVREWLHENQESYFSTPFKAAVAEHIYAGLAHLRSSVEADDASLFLRAVWVDWLMNAVGLATVVQDYQMNFPVIDYPVPLELARETLGRARRALRKAPSEEAKREYRMCRLLGAAAALRRFDQYWNALKPLLLALRAVGVPATGSDLRYWKEKNLPDPPEPWCEIPTAIAKLLRYARKQSGETTLTVLREEFASYCLERLKTRTKGNEEDEAGSADHRSEFVEPDENWRYAYIRAVRELHANPGGKGHRVLHWVSENDPDEENREAARVAYREMRHNTALPPGRSPLSALFAAFRWLRQAQIRVFNVEVDPDGVNRTREKEVRFTDQD